MYPSPPHWPHCGTVPEVLVVVGLAEVVIVVKVVCGAVVVVEVGVEVEVEVEPELEAGAPKSLRTSASKPELAYSWLMSHIMTPPKLAYDLLEAMAEANSEPSTYEPALAAPVLAAMPKRTLALRLRLTLLAQVSQVEKSQALGLLKLSTPQKLL